MNIETVKQWFIKADNDLIEEAQHAVQLSEDVKQFVLDTLGSG